MARSGRAFAAAVLVIGMSAAFVGSARAATPVTVLPYGAGGYRYQQVPTGGGDPNFDEVGFDDSTFGLGNAPFGNNGDRNCPLVATSPWSANTDLLLRRTVTLPSGATNVRIHVAIDNDIALFWNGTPIGSTVHEGCASPNSFSAAVPGGLLTPGDNLLAARARDRGGASFVDLEVTADRSENRPPDCSSVRMEPPTLWPPNHGFRTLTATGGTDPEGARVTLTITGVTQDEPLDATGDGNTTPDADITGLPSNQVRLRAERSGLGDGRVYRVAVMATDSDGASCSTTTFVGVPHDRRTDAAAVDTSAVVVDSFAAT